MDSGASATQHAMDRLLLYLACQRERQNQNHQMEVPQRVAHKNRSTIRDSSSSESSFGGSVSQTSSASSVSTSSLLSSQCDSTLLLTKVQHQRHRRMSRHLQRAKLGPTLARGSLPSSFYPLGQLDEAKKEYNTLHHALPSTSLVYSKSNCLSPSETGSISDRSSSLVQRWLAAHGGDDDDEHSSEASSVRCYGGDTTVGLADTGVQGEMPGGGAAMGMSSSSTNCAPPKFPLDSVLPPSLCHPTQTPESHPVSSLDDGNSANCTPCTSKRSPTSSSLQGELQDPDGETNVVPSNPSSHPLLSIQEFAGSQTCTEVVEATKTADWLQKGHEITESIPQDRPGQASSASTGPNGIGEVGHAVMQQVHTPSEDAAEDKAITLVEPSAPRSNTDSGSPVVSLSLPSSIPVHPSSSPHPTLSPATSDPTSSSPSTTYLLNHVRLIPPAHLTTTPTASCKHCSHNMACISCQPPSSAPCWQCAIAAATTSPCTHHAVPSSICPTCEMHRHTCSSSACHCGLGHCWLVANNAISTPVHHMPPIHASHIAPPPLRHCTLCDAIRTNLHSCNIPQNRVQAASHPPPIHSTLQLQVTLESLRKLIAQIPTDGHSPAL